MTLPVFITASGRLHGENAVAAILKTEDGCYVMQLRDSNPAIFYPDHWGCFGGAVDPAEEPLQALRRELREELEFECTQASEFTRFDFDFSPLGPGQKKVYRIYFAVTVSDEQYSRFVLHEGADFKKFTGSDLLSLLRVTPYDAFAVWLYMHQSRFA